MAIVNTLSTAITNRDAVPSVLAPAHLVRGVLYEAVGTVEKAGSDSNGSVYRVARFRSSDRISDIKVLNDAITGATSYDVGLYRTAYDGGAVVDADLFASAVDISSASTGAGADVTFEATPANVDKIEKRLWELLGLSADPQVEYDLALTANTAGAGAGTICARVRYCAGN
jgi:hypothetical protein